MIVFSLVWLTLGIVSTVSFFGYLHKIYPENGPVSRGDFLLGCFLVLLGPITVAALSLVGSALVLTSNKVGEFFSKPLIKKGDDT